MQTNVLPSSEMTKEALLAAKSQAESQGIKVQFANPYGQAINSSKEGIPYTCIIRSFSLGNEYDEKITGVLTGKKVRPLQAITTCNKRFKISEVDFLNMDAGSSVILEKKTELIEGAKRSFWVRVNSVNVADTANIANPTAVVNG